MATLFNYIYTSELSPETPSSSVADIVRCSKHNNQQRGITGLLIFDGEKFCQYLEGSETPVRILIECIKADRRHINYNKLHEGQTDQPRRFDDWSIAYTMLNVGPLDVYFKKGIASGQFALQTMEQLIPRLDLQPV